MAKETLFEALTRDVFSTSTKPSKQNLSTTSPENKVEISLDADLEFPDRSGYTVGSYLNGQNQDNSGLLDDYIKKYRKFSKVPEIDSAIDEIVNEAITEDNAGEIISLNFEDDENIGKKTKDTITESFERVKHMLNFDENASQLFRKWYIDGRLVVECIYDNDAKKNREKKGLKNLAILTPIGLKKTEDKEKKEIYYTYKEGNFVSTASEDVYKEEQILYVGSGFFDDEFGHELSYLHNSLKTINNMSMIEDMLVVYRLSRAAEKRVWNIDVGSMAKTKAENYLRNVMNEIKFDKKYNAETGELEGGSATMGLIEDYVFPTRNGNQSTSVDTIGGNTSFTDNLEDLQWFMRKLYISMKIPVSRIDTESSIEFGSDDILNSEEKFHKHIVKIRRKFGRSLFIELIKRDLLDRGELKKEEWDEIKNKIKLKWSERNWIIERARVKSFEERMDTFENVEEKIGKVISLEWAQRNILGLSSQQIEAMKEEIENEEKEGVYDKLKPDEEM